MEINFKLDYVPKLGDKKDYGIGIVGAGFIVKECHLPAYREAGYNVVGIYNRTVSKAQEVAEQFHIPNVYSSLEEMLSDPRIDVVDISVPPHNQIDIIREVAKSGKHILAQKPLAMNYKQAVEAVAICEEYGVSLVVNQNGRFDPAIRAAKNLIENGYIGKPVMATIELRFTPHWQPYQMEYDRLMFLFMSIHHLDHFRFLFGTPASIYAKAIPHPDGTYKGEYSGTYILEYDSGMMATAWDDGFTWDKEGFGVFYKIEGTEGVIKMDLGWPSGEGSKISFYSKQLNDVWYSPNLEGSWFPGAFRYTMGELFQTLETGKESSISGRNNLETMAMVEACYVSNQHKKAIKISEILENRW
ncbi:Gfo/Idh/MocA family protein [Sutcliffiella halmapala]|uniref:Gfo/Idh/MocA family protein n=1 Tax=Sutcliffiella halmapala TaxID=79882 RepID=UPI000995A373|nr:Gfo/Idh/MocA family oxidoreductase [Sutcliffiella halmapala]